jgi:DNA-binding transcriptional regulator YbjK
VPGHARRPHTMSQPVTDKGRARRHAIVTAAADLLLEGGPPAVTHRAVARRAGVSLGSTTYYFADRHELVAAAVDRARRADVARARSAAGAPAGGDAPDLAHRLVDVVVGLGRLADRELVAAHYRRFLGPAGPVAWRSTVSAWNREIRDAVGDTLDRHATGPAADGAVADTVVALVDGLVLAWLVDDTHDDPRADAGALVGAIRTALARLGL